MKLDAQWHVVGMGALCGVLVATGSCYPGALQALLDPGFPPTSEGGSSLDDDAGGFDPDICANPGLLDDCTQAPRCGQDSGVCEAYEDDESEHHWGFSQKCVCECMPDTDLNDRIRTCKTCMEEKGVHPEDAHWECYEALGAGLGTFIEVGFLCGHCAVEAMPPVDATKWGPPMCLPSAAEGQ